MSAADAAGQPVAAFLVPGIPHPLLVPEQNPGWQRLRDAFDQARESIAQIDADLLLIYSTMWPSVIGHQIQADPEPAWVHVDELFHDLGSIPYRFRMDADFAESFRECAIERGLHARTVAYHGFPIDTGSVVALKLLNPENALPACIVSSNVYADRAETIVLGKAARNALAREGKKAVVVVVSTLSNRLFTDFIAPEDDAIHSSKDDEWNRKILEFLGDGRLEDVAQLSRELHGKIRVHKVVNFKPMWWLSAVMGQHNRYTGNVYAYEALHGTGGAVVSLLPSEDSVGDKEYDEEDVDRYRGDRTVLGGLEQTGSQAGAAANVLGPSPTIAVESSAGGVGGITGRTRAASETAANTFPNLEPLADRDVLGGGQLADGETIRTKKAPAPVGSYPHARRVGDLLYLSGVGPRQPGTNAIPGGPIQSPDGEPLDYDIRAQTQAVIDNVAAILEASGSNLDRVIDVTAFLVDMDRDFADYNAVYSRTFKGIQATRTTLAIQALPTPIAVEFKVVALAGDAPTSRRSS